METGGQGLNFHYTSSQLINTEDSEFWINPGSFGDSFIETSSAMIQSAERRKRQNCGHSFHGHQHMFGAVGETELGSNLSMAAEGDVSDSYGPRFAGVQGGMSQGSREDTRNFRSGDCEAATSTLPSFSIHDERAVKSQWNVVLPSPEEGSFQYSASNPAGHLTNSYHPYMRDESRHSYKRKSCMESSAGSLPSRASSSQRENDFVGFAPVSATRILQTPSITAYDEPQLTRDGHYVFHCPRTGALHHAQNERVNRQDCANTTRPQESFHSPSIRDGLPSQALIPRRMHTAMIGSADNRGIGLPEILPFRQGNGLSAPGMWRANNAFAEDGNNQSNNHGNQARHSLSDALGITTVDSRVPQPPNRVSRAVHSREFNLHASHQAAPNPYVYGGGVDLQAHSISAAQSLNRFSNAHHPGSLLRFPPSGTAAALNSISQAAYGAVHPSFATERAMPPPLARYNDTNQWSCVQQVSLRGQRALPSEGINRHRFAASREFFNQSLVYGNGDFADIHDQHSNMRLDVDNMSYEELLALEERIGNVNTGLSEDNLDKCLKISTYSCCDTSSGETSQESDLKCSVCQEEYVEGDELGQLECGHGYHAACIKQWLVLKNQCPICKATAACSKAEKN